MAGCVCIGGKETVKEGNCVCKKHARKEGYRRKTGRENMVRKTMWHAKEGLNKAN